MIYYLFPRTFINILNTCCKFGPIEFVSRYSSSLNHYLKQIESHTSHLNDWDKVCYSSNPLRLLVGNDDKRSLIMYEVIELYHLIKFSWVEGIDQLDTLHANKWTIPAIEHIRRNNNNQNDTHVFMDTLSTYDDFLRYSTLSIDIAFCEAASTNEYANNINLLLQLCVTFCTLKKKERVLSSMEIPSVVFRSIY